MDELENFTVELNSNKQENPSLGLFLKSKVFLQNNIIQTQCIYLSL